VTPTRRLVLAGGGHAHLFVLERFARHPMPGVELLLVTPHDRQRYSGLLPSWMAGTVDAETLTIDVGTLARRAGARWVAGSLAGIDARARRLRLDDGSWLETDLLSLDTGSVGDPSVVAPDGAALSVRPIERFVGAWPAMRGRLNEQRNARLVIVGAGAAGAELALAARTALGPDAAITLVSADGGAAANLAPSLRRRLGAVLAERNVALVAGVARVEAGGVHIGAEGEVLAADAVIVATGGRAPGWLADSGLARSDDGFVSVDATHRSISHDWVFAAGDVAARVDVPLPRSGVHAVRAGPVLALNLVAALDGSALRAYRPRRRTLAILAVGARDAIASWGSWTARGMWVWWWKRQLDLAFMRRFAAR
jgi:pyridine nucleotide-disulfide oxidoreductase family protein